jgi:hypothetical protein
MWQRRATQRWRLVNTCPVHPRHGVQFLPVKPAPPPLLSTRITRRHALLGAITASGFGCANSPAPALHLDDDPPEVLQINFGAANVELQFAPGLAPSVRALSLDWVHTSANAVMAYFGRFPLPQVELLIVPEPGGGVLGGTSHAEPSPLLRLRVGTATTADQFAADWILVHEMAHLAVPRLPRTQNWLHEGIATYVEAVARGRAGLVNARDVWLAWVRQMPLGLPQTGEGGMDQTPTWARTYWGGAMFCLLADVRSRQRGTPARGLQQALQGVLAAGGDFRAVWPVQRLLTTADAALGQTTLTALYDEMKDRPVRVDLPALWRELGVGDGMLRDDAPLAALRRAILA